MNPLGYMSHCLQSKGTPSSQLCRAEFSLQICQRGADQLLAVPPPFGLRNGSILHSMDGADKSVRSGPWYSWRVCGKDDLFGNLSETPLLPVFTNLLQGLWQGGSGFAGSSDFALALGNGDIDVTSNPKILGDSVVKFSIGLKVCGAPCPSFMCQAGVTLVLLSLTLSFSWHHAHRVDE